MARKGYKPAPMPPVVAGKCSKHGRRVPPGNICFDCHHDALDAAGFDWRAISNLRPMGGATGLSRSRTEL